MMQPEISIFNEIAQSLQCGFTVYVHKQTLEIIEIPDEDQLDYMDENPWQEDRDKVDANPGDYYLFEKMDSFHGFRVREHFAATVTDPSIRQRLEQALSGKKPFANFKIQVDNSGPYRDLWFTFWNEQEQQWVKRQWEAQQSLSNDSIED